MPSLASVRSIDPTETFQPLGPPIRPQQGVEIPLPKPTGTPGVVEMPDGKLATELPLPPVKPAVRVHDSFCFYGDYARSLAASPEWFQQEFMADLSNIEQRVTAFYGGAIGKLVADSFSTTTGRVRSTARIVSVSPTPPELYGKRADFIVFDDLDNLGELP